MICGCAGHLLALYAGYWRDEALRAKDHIDASCHARLALTMAAFNVLVQWQGFQPYASGFVPLSMAEFSL